MKENDYLKIKSSKFLKGATLVYENANRHFKCAKILAENKEYGLANTHLILSAEECIKSISLILKAVNSGFDSNKLIDLFHKHKIRHEFGLIMFLFGELADKLIYGLINKAESMDNPTPEEIKQAKADHLKNFENWITNDLENPNNDVNRKCEWWKKANFQRNRGTYVDYNNGCWCTPNEIKKEDYNLSYNIVANLLSNTELMVHKSQNELNQMYKEFLEVMDNAHLTSNL